MSYSFETLPEAPAVMITWNADFDPETELGMSTLEAIALLEQQPEPVYYLANLMHVDLDLEGMMRAASQAGQGPAALFRHPKVREVVFATGSDMIEMGARGMDSEAYDYIKIRVFRTLEEALDYVRNG